MISMRIKHLVSIFLLPVTMLIILPALIINSYAFNLLWRLSFPLNIAPIILGLFSFVLGLILLFSTIFLFISKGRGTIGPWFPTQELITSGIYSYVRNPMITGVFFVLVGENIFFGSFPLLVYSFGFFLVNLVYIPLIEEPKLEKKFGKQYLIYKEKTPRWIPFVGGRTSNKLISE